MMELVVKVESEAEIRQWGRHHSEKVKRAASRAMNESGRKARTRLLRAISDETGLKYGIVRKGGSLRQTFATPNRLYFGVWYKHRVPFVEHQKGRKNFARTQGGRLRFLSWGGKYQVVHGAFRYGGRKNDKANNMFYHRVDGKPKPYFGGSVRLDPRIQDPLRKTLLADFNTSFSHQLRREGYPTLASLRSFGGASADIGH